MNKSLRKCMTFGCFLFLFAICSKTEKLIVMSEVEGPIKTNCYLLYELPTREAAIFDIAGPLDSLVKAILENHLILKYIFITHAHWDHVEGLFDLKEKFPKAKICLSKEEYMAMQGYKNFAKESDPEKYGQVMQDSALARMVSIDLHSIKPDIFLEDDEEYTFGHSTIRALLTPGHSAGGMCFLCNHYLFSGDVLFYRTVGNTDFYKASRTDQIQSVRKLYKLLPDSTIIYPGHGPFTDIGSEKKENKKISVDGGDWVVR